MRMFLVFSFFYGIFSQISICVFVYSQVRPFFFLIFFLALPELKLGINLNYEYILFVCV